MENVTFFYFANGNKHGAIKAKPIPPGKSSVIFDFRLPKPEPNKIMVAAGKNYYDIISFYDGLGFFVSEKFKAVVESNSLTGLTFFPLEFLDNERKYYGIKFESHKIRMAESTPEIKYLNIRDWDGSDFFLFNNTTFGVCTERAKAILESNKISGIYFENCIELVDS
jgi:hypothetical protein